jgi:hypothetical protein
MQAVAANTLTKLEKDIQSLCGHLLQAEQVGEAQQVDLKVVAQTLGEYMPLFVNNINDVIISQGDSNFRKNLVGNTKQLVQITTELLKDSQTDYKNLSPEDIQRVAQLKIRAQEVYIIIIE